MKAENTRYGVCDLITSYQCSIGNDIYILVVDITTLQVYYVFVNL